LLAPIENHCKTLILGIGNTLLSDEGVGIHVLTEITRRDALTEGTCLMDGGTLSFTLAGPIEECEQFIVIDAAELNSAPGTIKVFEADEMDTYITTGNQRSVHEVSLADVMSIALLSGNLPEKRALIGIQPQLVDWGEHPTADVAAAIPLAADEVQKLIGSWSDVTV